MNEPTAKAFYEEYWDGADGTGDAPTGAFSPELKQLIVRSLPPSPGILDAGCGDGAKYGDWLAGLSSTYLGVDISERAVEAARRRGLNARVIPDLAETGMPDSSFDACIAIEVLEHLLFPQFAMKEIYRVLRPGGVFIATVPNTAYWRYRLDLLLMGRWQGAGTTHPWRDPHLRFFNGGTLRRMANECGFEVLRVTGVNGSLFGDLPYVRRRFGTERMSRPFAGLQTRLPGLFGLSIAIVARRPQGHAPRP